MRGGQGGPEEGDGHLPTPGQIFPLDMGTATLTPYGWCMGIAPGLASRAHCISSLAVGHLQLTGGSAHVAGWAWPSQRGNVRLVPWAACQGCPGQVTGALARKVPKTTPYTNGHEAGGGGVLLQASFDPASQSGDLVVSGLWGN